MHSISLDVTLSDSERKIHMVGLRHDLLIYIITTRIRQKDLIYKDHKPLKMCRIQGINHGLGTSRNIKRLFLIENWVSYIKRDAPRSRSGLGKFRDPDSVFFLRVWIKDETMFMYEPGISGYCRFYLAVSTENSISA